MSLTLILVRIFEGLVLGWTLFYFVKFLLNEMVRKTIRILHLAAALIAMTAYVILLLELDRLIAP